MTYPVAPTLEIRWPKNLLSRRHPQGRPQLLEPVMKVETVTTGDYLGDVIGDMNRRCGTILDQIERGANIAVVATVPLR